MKVIYGENQMKLVTEEITKIGARSDVLQNKVPAGNGSDPVLPVVNPFFRDIHGCQISIFKRLSSDGKTVLLLVIFRS